MHYNIRLNQYITSGADNDSRAAAVAFPHYGHKARRTERFWKGLGPVELNEMPPGGVVSGTGIYLDHALTRKMGGAAEARSLLRAVRGRPLSTVKRDAFMQKTS